MVDSSQKKQIDNNGASDEGLMRVAAIAAVQSYIKCQEEERGDLISDKYIARPTNWGVASLMEGIGSKPFSSPPEDGVNKKIWGQLISILVAVSVSSAVSVQEARSQATNTLSGSSAESSRVKFRNIDQIRYRDSQKFGNEKLTKAQNSSIQSSYAPAFNRGLKYKPVRPLVAPHVFMYNRIVPEEDIQENIQPPVFGSSKKTVFVKVGLLTGVDKVEFDTFDGAQVIDLSSQKVIAQIKPEGKFIVSTARPGGHGKIAFTPKSSYDSTLLAKIDSSVRKVSFTPPSIPKMPYIVRSTSKRKKGRIARLHPSLVVPIKPGALPKEYLSGRSGNDLSTLSGVLIAPKNYATESSKSVFSLNGRAYRGALLIAPRSVKTKRGAEKVVFNAINVIDIEDYLFSVLPSEMPSKWPLEALKAQAIAARSYVIANLGKHQSNGYDVKASIYDQAYTGIKKEHDNTNRAVLETKGIVMKHDNKVVSAFFHSSGGGKTEVSQHVWSKELPYLKSVPDFDHSSPHLSWKKGYKRETLEKKFGLHVGSINAIFPIERSPSNRVKTLLVVGDKGADLMAGRKVRSLLGLPGTNFNVNYENGSYVFVGQGFGHGLGLSQWGAKVLAKHGYNAAQILKYYYKDVTFSQIFEERAL